ncbi:multidrug efflux SMR transporter [Aureimonas sp. SK2]|uniref:DMT family transporter n=1 Tax=Aureimonas sp. SK2 TaxID=3015992 RepID=UPI0024451FB6|nr:multidrug efflux SMR transporter [Aureimonas sp. SK2]
MPWVYLLVAGLLEIGWASAMKQSAGFTRVVPSVVTFVLMFGSFGLLAAAMRSLPLGTAYAVWTGIGALGAFFVGLLWFGESAHPMRILAAVLILSGIVLMKWAPAG